MRNRELLAILAACALLGLLVIQVLDTRVDARDPDEVILEEMVTGKIHRFVTWSDTDEPKEWGPLTHTPAVRTGSRVTSGQKTDN